MSKDNEVVAKRYAAALFEIAKEQNVLEQVEKDMELVKDVVLNKADLQSFLAHPKVAVAKKQHIVKESFGPSVSKHVLNTLLLLVERHRGEIIDSLAVEFFKLANEERSVAEAKVYSVKPLSDAEKASLSEVFAKKVGKKTLKIENKIDKNLLGGVKIQIGNRIYDGSISGKLARIERQLVRK
jgi:F-type H+-transporting ATPase subunit delta